ncbi:MAG: methylenetetrahydrofolate reductase [NAD(P)H] [Acidobacteria bacterium]|nr:methylenetetrahydrofolate reductase [NAD(P)H] [Acidobacteriota bacterium]
MSFIREVFAAKAAAKQPVVSFEFFPTKTPEGERTLLEKTIPALGQLNPDFCSVTYGAGGSTRENTLTIVDRIQREQQITAMAHVTCVNATREETAAVLNQAKSLGITNVLALRGDPPGGVEEFRKTAGGFEFSYELVRFIKERGDFSIGVAGFPEGHIAQKEGKHADWRHLKHKIDQGADFVITQLFFSNKDYFEFRDFLAGLGVSVPLMPGIIPILSAAQIKRFVGLCGADLPRGLVEDLDRLGADGEAAVQFGIDYATRQAEELLKQGAPGLHFYTLNKSRSTSQILKNLNLA